MLKLCVSSVSSSVADNTIVEDTSSSSKLTSDTLASTGASLTAFTVKLTDAVSDRSPSVTVNVKLSSPL